MENFDLYRDIATRTGGDIYVGVVGPVRTGKSTLIKQVMQQFILDGIIDENDKRRAIDEIPQSADGKTVMTTQPKFVPNEAVKVHFSDKLALNMRMVDCVGYMVDGALGGVEDGRERVVMTPWSDKGMPFAKAAEIGTEKVIKEHSTIALAVFTDGSFSEIPRDNYQSAEDRIVKELKDIGKPFAIILNTADPLSPKAVELRTELQAKYDAPVLLKNVMAIGQFDIAEIMESILMEFEVKLIDFDLPRWIQALDTDSKIVAELLNIVSELGKEIHKMKDFDEIDKFFENTVYWKLPEGIELDAGKGRIEVKLMPKSEIFYKVLSDECGVEINDDFDLMNQLRNMAYTHSKSLKLADAMEQVASLGYGIVMPSMDEIELKEPELLKQGQQYGIKLKATAPSLHIMRVDVETEVAPIVGSEQQSADLVESMLSDFENDKQAIWDMNIFGRSLSSLVADGIINKLSNVPSEAEVKLKKTLTRIVNEGKGGVICILL